MTKWQCTKRESKLGCLMVKQFKHTNQKIQKKNDRTRKASKRSHGLTVPKKMNHDVDADIPILSSEENTTTMTYLSSRLASRP